MSKLLNKYGILLAMIVALLSLYIWNADGAWQQGALPTKGLYRVLIFAGLATFSFSILSVLNKK